MYISIYFQKLIEFQQKCILLCLFRRKCGILYYDFDSIRNSFIIYHNIEVCTSLTFIGEIQILNNLLKRLVGNEGSYFEIFTVWITSTYPQLLFYFSAIYSKKAAVFVVHLFTALLSKTVLLLFCSKTNENGISLSVCVSLRLL